MMDRLAHLAHLLKHLQQVPYLASKNIYRVASHFLHMDEQKLEQFCASLRQAKEGLALCQVCFCWQERDGACLFCTNKERDQSLVCVVEVWYEALSIERTRAYDGVYHVLGGAISPLNGVGAEDLSIEPLIKRVDAEAKELIFALSQTPEGEATASYIASKLKDRSVKITCLARGMPVGSSLGAVDRLTVYKALADRRPF